MSKNKTVLITGGTGFLGSHLADKLLAEDYKVILMGRGTSLNNISHLLGNKKVEFVKGEITNADDVRKALDNADIVFHLAAFTNVKESINEPKKDFDTSVTGTIILLESMRRQKKDKLVYISAGRVYGIPKYVPVDEKHPICPVDPYGLGKYIGEEYCKFYGRNYGIKTIILRLFSVYGPRQIPKPNSTTGIISIFVDKVIKGENIIIYGDGKLKRDLLHVSDFKNIVFNLVKEDLWSNIFNVASGDIYQIKDIAELVISIAKKKGSKIIFEKPLAGDINLYPDITKLKSMINFKPSVDLKDGIVDYVNWLRYTAGQKI